MIRRYNINNILLISSLLPLIVVYVSEYFFNLHPCKLCIYQRIPFFIILALSIGNINLLKNSFRSIKKFYDILYYKICAILFLINSIIAFYHAGVEKKIFKISGSCSSSSLNNANNIEELRILLENSEIMKCDIPPFEIFGITIAGGNFIYSFILFLMILKYICSHSYKTKFKP